MSMFDLTPAASLFSAPDLYLERSVTVGGWLTSARFGKKVGFLVLSDGSSHAPIQVVVPLALLDATPELRALGAGCAVRATGRWVASLGAGQSHELQAEQVVVVGDVEDPSHYPIQPKAHSPEFLRSVPHLRPRTAQFGAIARLRHVLARFIHDHLEDQGFLWVATPILSSVDAEGAGERFRVTTLAAGEQGEDFFARDAFLTVSGQLEAEALCAALSRVYTFGPTFRAEGSHTSRHLAEFWMVEPEMAFADLDDAIVLAEGLLRGAVAACLERLPQEMAYFAQEGGRSLAEWAAFVAEPFARVTYDQAIAQLALGPFTGIAWGMDLQSEHEKWLVEQAGRALIVTDYPAGIKSFYMQGSADGRTVAAMDILVPGMGELVGGSAREADLGRLLARMEERGMDPAEYGHYLDLRRYGSVPHAGFGLGFERLVAYVAGLASIKDATFYPKFAGG